MGPRAGRQRQRPGAGRKRLKGALWGNLAAVLVLPVLATLDPTPAWAADAGGASDFVLMAIVLAAGGLGPAGGHLAVFLEPEGRETSHGLDFRGALDAMPAPAWIRGKDLSLSFVNRALLAASGGTEEAALTANVALDRPERDLAATAHGNNETIEAKRFAMLSGQRHALAFTLAPLADGSVAGAALDVTGLAEAEARLQQHIEAHADSLDRIATAAAIYGPDRKLTFFNRAHVSLLGLPETWLQTHPAYGDVLDRLRELRRLPDQPDFRVWKQQRLKLFEHRESHPEERWHLPSGQTLRVIA